MIETDAERELGKSMLLAQEDDDDDDDIYVYTQTKIIRMLMIYR